MNRIKGVTLAELLTALVVVVVLTAAAIPMWSNHLLRLRREDAIAALVAVQNAQDKFFGRNARYANASGLTTHAPAGLGLAATSQRGFYRIELQTSDDALKYTAVAQAQTPAGEREDTRCARLSIDQLGIRRATDSEGVDRSGDCWR